MIYIVTITINYTLIPLFMNELIYIIYKNTSNQLNNNFYIIIRIFFNFIKN
jgi:hypothetical protein